MMTPTTDRRGTAGPHRGMAGLLRWLPGEPPSMPVAYSRPLIAYVSLIAAAAVAAAALTVRPAGDALILVLGGAVTLLMASTAVRVLSGIDSNWSVSIFAHLCLSLVAGPMGALVAAASEAGGEALRFRSGWFRSGYNVTASFLSDLAAWGTFHAIAGGHLDFGIGVGAGICAGAAQYVVNIALLVGVQKIHHRDLAVWDYLRNNVTAVLPYHLGAGATAFGAVILVDAEGAGGFLLILVPVLLLQMFLLVLASRSRAADAQRIAHARERERLHQETLEASEAEHRRIARNLHDGVVQDLAAIAMGLRREARYGDGGEAVAMVRAADATTEAIEELRTLLHEIAPPDLEEVGLTAALDDLAEPLREAGLAVHIGVAAGAGAVQGAALVAVYRIAREALRNVAQHAQASHVQVAVWRRDGHLGLDVTDDGLGFSADQRRRQAQAGHLGLSLIGDLARQAGGVLEVDSGPRRGTAVHARVPVDAAPQGEPDGAAPRPAGAGDAAASPADGFRDVAEDAAGSGLG